MTSNLKVGDRVTLTHKGSKHIVSFVTVIGLGEVSGDSVFDYRDTSGQVVWAYVKDILPELANGERFDIAIKPGSISWRVVSSKVYEETYGANCCEVYRNDNKYGERYTITLHCYYDHTGELSMTITQPLELAIITFAKLLIVDSEMN